MWEKLLGKDDLEIDVMAAISFSNALGVHERALHLRTERSAVLANNLANAETPGFKSRDFDFGAVLKAAKADRSNMQMARTNAGHLAPAANESGVSVDLSYRVPLQPSIDGNTVDPQMESAVFARNALEFGASFRFLNGRFSGLSKAISGQ
jgi:flagellar basal-body rod protein FlgB